MLLMGLDGMCWNGMVVARDGIEPPTPAFSGLPDNAAKWLGISGYL
jgi:hypothetical protein